MKPQLLKSSINPLNSFSVRRDVVPYINNKWHYHIELELIYFKKGTGTQFIGDSIKNFKSGDVILVGKNLPHYWRYDDKYFDAKNKISADSTVVHFCDDFWGEKFLGLPENQGIKLIIEKAQRGVCIHGKSKLMIADILEKMLVAEGAQKISLLLEALWTVYKSQYSLLSSMGFKNDFKENENERINAIYEYSLANFKDRIKIEDIADIASISPNSFCRYFKSRTNKTYSQFLIEIKVGHACKLLIENRLSVKQVCFESGFHNFATFHKYFKQVKGLSPLSYQKEFMAKNS